MSRSGEASLVDAREAPFWWVDWRVWALMDQIGVDGFAVYCAVRAIEQAHGLGPVTHASVARATKLPESVVADRVISLVDAGLLTIERVAA